MKIGIDFGTTHTIVAHYDGEELYFVPLDGANKESHLLRSMIYITKEDETYLGIEAIRHYLKDNTGRLTQYEQKMVGTIENWVAQVSRGPLEPDGPIHYIQDVIVETDVASPGRLLQSIKTGLRDPLYGGTNIFKRFYTVQELIAILLDHAIEQTERYFRQMVTEVVLGRPVKFGESEEIDEGAKERLLEAAEMAGLPKVTLMAEPVAAAQFYTHELETPQRVFVFDFGGGTLDMTILESHPKEDGGSENKILATQGVLVGGDDFDRAIMQHKVGAFFGTKSRIDRQGGHFPAYLEEKLFQWQTIPDLSRVEYLPLLRKAKLHSDNPQAFHALETLALKNYGYTLFERIEQAKCELSSETESSVVLKKDEIDLDAHITRQEFQSFIVDEMAKVQLAINKILENCEVTAVQIDAVVTTGGSSLIPIFNTILQKRFPNAKLIRSDTFGSVAAGLAMYAHTL